MPAEYVCLCCVCLKGPATTVLHWPPLPTRERGEWLNVCQACTTPRESSPQSNRSRESKRVREALKSAVVAAEAELAGLKGRAT